MTMTAKQYLAASKELSKMMAAVRELETRMSEAETALRQTVDYKRLDSGTVILTKDNNRVTLARNSRGRLSVIVRESGKVKASNPDSMLSINDIRLKMALNEI